MSRRRKKKSRPIASYLNSAKSNKDLVPSLGKYGRRQKNLTRWEKAAITRAENKIKRAGGRQFLFPLSKKQVKNLKDKSPVIGNGVRAARFRNTSADAKLSVRGGEIQILSNGRPVRYVSLEPDVLVFLDKIRELFRDKNATEVWTWTVKGRSNRSWGAVEVAEIEIFSAFNKYKMLESDWLLGLAYLGDG